MTLGLCMIVKNEEDVLHRCLESAADVFDEIIIADTGSADSTKQIASAFTDKIYDFKWCYDFAAARNFAFSLASTDYIMWLDADDVLLEKDRDALKALKAKMDGSIDAYYLRYDAAFDEFGNATTFFYRERIVKRACGFVWRDPVHESLCISGRVSHENIAVTHKKGPHKERGRNLFIFAKLFAGGTKPSDRQKYYFARELCDNGLYDTAASAFEWFLQSDGWIEDKICACRLLAYCYRQRGEREKRLAALFRSFDFAPPRAETCCDLGEYFMERGDYATAVFWYKLAANEPPPENGFICPDYSGFIPYMWLCVCFDKLGDLSRAKYYNDLAGKIKPFDRNYLYNKQYFEKIFYGEEKKNE